MSHTLRFELERFARSLIAETNIICEEDGEEGPFKDFIVGANNQVVQGITTYTGYVSISLYYYYPVSYIPTWA